MEAEFSLLASLIDLSVVNVMFLMSLALTIFYRSGWNF